MTKRINKLISIILAVLVFCSVLPVTQLVPTANAADLYDAEINAKIQTQKSLFKQDEYFAGNYYTHFTLTKSSPTKICSCPSDSYCPGDACYCDCGSYYNHNGYWIAGQCFGFACQMGFNVFGIDPSSIWSKHKKVADLKVGDIVYFSWDGSTTSIHAIFVTGISSDTVYYADSNSSGPCQIDWKKSMSKERLADLLDNNSSNKFSIYTAPNNKYGEHSCSFGSNYLCTKCGAVNPSKIATMSDTSYIVITDNAKSRKGPYETCSKVKDIAKDTILTVNGKMTNTKNKLWYRLTDGSWIYSEHIKKYSITYADIADGCYRIKNVSNGQYLIVDSGDGSNGKNVSVWPLDTGATEQKWNLIEDSLGFKIHTALSSGRIINSYGTSVNAGNNVNIWDLIYGDPTQRWKFQKVSGGYVIRNVSVPSCVLTVENGRNVKVDTFRSGDKTQIWVIESAAGCSHTYDDGVLTTLPTCTTSGIRTYSCTKCGNSYTTTVSYPGHSYDSGTVTKVATCTQSGSKLYTCTSCGSTKTESTPKREHNFNSGSVTKQATCTETGIKTYTCYLCDYQKTETIAAKGHKEEAFDGREATCTEYGWKTGSKCAVCDKVLSGNEVLYPTGHLYTSKVTKAANCTQRGTKTYTCTKCGATKSESIAATGHNYESKTTVSATCYRYGEKISVCKCGDETNKNIIKPKAHTDSDKNGFCDVCKLNMKSQSILKLSVAENTDKYITINIMAENAADLTAADLSLQYDESTLKYSDFVFGYDFYELCNMGYADFALGDDDGLLRVAIAIISDSLNINESVVLLQIKFYKIKSAENLSVELSGSYSDYLSISGHTHKVASFGEEVPTCTENGHTAGTRCETCGEILSGNKTLAATGHSLVQVTKTTDDYCINSIGKNKVYYCSKCDYRKGTDGIAYQHCWQDKGIVTNSKGEKIKRYTCIECGYNYDSELDKNGNPVRECPDGALYSPPSFCPGVSPGDVDYDNKITAVDARLALRASVGLEKFDSQMNYAADVDKNGSITATDARLILRASVGLEYL